MIIIIDGYNMMKHAQSRPIEEQERSHFIHTIARYGHRKKHAMIIVFDGGTQTWPSKEKFKEVTVIYSGRLKSADEVIKSYISEHRGKELFLVSSDNELALYASRHEVVSIGSSDFDYLVQEALKSNKEGDKGVMEPEILLDDTVHDLDTLMELGSQVIPSKEEDLETNKKRRAAFQSISKKDRTVLKKLNKL